MPTIQSLAVHERPREKLLARGQGNLSDVELLQVVIGSGIRGADVTAIADSILQLLQRHNGKVTVDQLLRVRGVGKAAATKLVASLELTGRFNHTGKQIMDESAVLGMLEDIRYRKQEHFIVITLDGANRLIEKRIVTVGTLNESLVHPREVFADAITDRAAGIVVAHNHPGGSMHASGPDLLVTKRLRAAGELLGIKLLDHIVITPQGHFSIDTEA